jgi:hypothetical protein
MSFPKKMNLNWILKKRGQGKSLSSPEKMIQYEISNKAYWFPATARILTMHCLFRRLL